MTTFAGAAGVLPNPVSTVDAISTYETRLGTIRDGVVFSYVSALLARATSLSASDSNNLVELFGALLAAFVLRRIFRELRLSPRWLLAAVLSPVFLFYGNVNLKDAWDLAFLLLLIHCVISARRGANYLALAALSLMSSYVLYYDREYYIFLGLLVALGDRTAGILEGPKRWLRYSIFAALLVLVYQTAGLERFGAYNAAGSIRALVFGLPHTLLAPIGLHDSLQAVLFAMSLSVFLAYIAICHGLISYVRGVHGEVARYWARRSWIWVFTFAAVIVEATRVEGGGFERGRDALAPLLFVGAALLIRAALEAQSPKQSSDDRTAQNSFVT